MSNKFFVVPTYEIGNSNLSFRPLYTAHTYLLLQLHKRWMCVHLILSSFSVYMHFILEQSYTDKILLLF